jgi:hypothetical protein
MTTPSRISRTTGLVVLALFFGGLTGFLLAAGNGITLDGHDHNDPSHHQTVGDHHGDNAHAHGEMFDGGDQPPRVRLSLLPDTVGGWNVELIAENFKFVPERVGGEAVRGEGHAHLYVDGVKIARLYSPWYHLPSLEKGQHEIMVSLNAHDHRVFSEGGQPVQARLIIDVTQ